MIWSEERIRRHLSFGMLVGYAGEGEAGNDGLGGSDDDDNSSTGGGGGYDDLGLDDVETSYSGTTESTRDTNTSAPGTAGAGTGSGENDFGQTPGWNPSAGMGKFTEQDVNDLGKEVDNLSVRGGFEDRETQVSGHDTMTAIGDFLSLNPAVSTGITAVAAAMFGPLAGLVSMTAQTGVTHGEAAAARTAATGALTLGIAPTIGKLATPGIMEAAKLGHKVGGVPGAMAGAYGAKKGVGMAMDYGIDTLMDQIDFEGLTSGPAEKGPAEAQGGGEDGLSSLLAPDIKHRQPKSGKVDAMDFSNFLERLDPYNYYKDILDLVETVEAR